MDWVNVVWFTDLFEYNSLEEESIASVVSLLETLDEDDAQFSNKELMKTFPQNHEKRSVFKKYRYFQSF